MFLHVETSTGNDTLMVGIEGSILFRADSSEGWFANSMAWPMQYAFSNGNIIGPLSEGAEVIYSARSVAVFEIRAWHAEFGTNVTDPDTTLLGLVDFGGAPVWDSSGEVWRITFTPTDTGTITIDSAYIPPNVQLVVTTSSGNVPIEWQKATVHVVSVCPVPKTGDATGDGRITAADIIYLVNFVFRGGAPPLPCEAVGDTDCSLNVETLDILVLVDYIFRSKGAPCNICTLIVGGEWTCP